MRRSVHKNWLGLKRFTPPTQTGTVLVQSVIMSRKMSDLLQIKTEIFLVDPSLHVGRVKVKVKGQGHKNAEIVFVVNAKVRKLLIIAYYPI